MMLKPSYSELMDIFNKKDIDNQITSRYIIVIAAAKRARQLIENADRLGISPDKAVSLSVSEMYNGDIDIIIKDKRSSGGDAPDEINSENKNY